MRRSLLCALLVLMTAPLHATRFSGWVPAWDEAALDSLQAEGELLDEVNPVWYLMKADGSIGTVWNAENDTWLAAMTGLDVVPTIQNFNEGRFDGAMAQTILADERLRRRHIDELVYLVVTRAWAGIDLDYEALPATARSDFSRFVTELAEELHRRGKVLSVTVHPKTSDSQDWKGPGSQDWRVIGAAADSVKIMAYDYHWSTSDAGPLAPLSWLIDVARYASTVIPAEKITMGLPWYGYDWAGRSGKGVTWTQATATAQARGVEAVRTADGELTYSYDGRTVFFQDGESFRAKTAAILEAVPGIGGFTQWRLGGEDARFWDVIRELRGSESTAQATDSTSRRRPTRRGRG